MKNNLNIITYVPQPDQQDQPDKEWIVCVIM